MLLDRQNPHGGDIYTHRGVLDFSSNINPFGTPEAVRQAVSEAAAHLSAYPDPYCRELVGALSAYEELPAEMILCGNGAAELIYSFAYALPKKEKALIVSPTFSEYASALAAAGIAYEHFMLQEENGFRPEIAPEDTLGYSAVFLCSPNNPTGITVPREQLVRLLETGTRVFADLCFLELTEAPERYELKELVKAFPNLTVLKAFTKSFAVPGLRLGYVLCSDPDFLRTMSEKTQCWNVSLPAEKAGVAALSCLDFLTASVRFISGERARVSAALSALGVRVFPGEANYLLLYSEAPLYEKLLDRGILVRDCRNYPGLRPGYYRIAIRTAEENDRLIAAMKEVLH